MLGILDIGLYNVIIYLSPWDTLTPVIYTREGSVRVEWSHIRWQEKIICSPEPYLHCTKGSEILQSTNWMPWCCSKSVYGYLTVFYFFNKIMCMNKNKNMDLWKGISLFICFIPSSISHLCSSITFTLLKQFFTLLHVQFGREKTRKGEWKGSGGRDRVSIWRKKDDGGKREAMWKKKCQEKEWGQEAWRINNGGREQKQGTV